MDDVHWGFRFQALWTGEGLRVKHILKLGPSVQYAQSLFMEQQRHWRSCADPMKSVTSGWCGMRMQDTVVSHKDSLPLPSAQLLESFCQQQIVSKLPSCVSWSYEGCATSLEEDDEGVQHA